MVQTILHLHRLDGCGVKFHSCMEAHLNTDNELVRNVLLAVLSSLAKIEAQKSRKEAKRRFTREEMDHWLTERDVTLVGGELDESPMAYGACRKSSLSAGTVKVRPFAVAMANVGEFDPFKD